MRRLASLVAGLLFASGCSAGGVKTGNGVTVDLRAVSSAAVGAGEVVPEGQVPGALLSYDFQGTPFRIESARAYLGKLNFFLPEGTNCLDVRDFEFRSHTKCNANRVEIPGPFLVELMSGVFTPALKTIAIPEGLYDRVDLFFEPAPMEGAGVPPEDPLLGETIYVTGSFDYLDQPRTFEFLLRFTDLAALRSAKGIAITEERHYEVDLRLDVALWLAETSVTACLDSGELKLIEDHLILTDTHVAGGACTAVEDAIAAAIRESGMVEANVTK